MRLNVGAYHHPARFSLEERDFSSTKPTDMTQLEMLLVTIECSNSTSPTYSIITTSHALLDNCT